MHLRLEWRGRDFLSGRVRAVNRFNDREMCYRRGYEHGAWELLHSIEHLIPQSARDVARDWIRQDVKKWRADRMGGEAQRAHHEKLS